MSAALSVKLYLLDRNIDMCSAWNKYFFGLDGVEVVCSDFCEFMRRHSVDGVVSPANAYGLMDGGYDGAITAWFGNSLQERVREHIVARLYGEQPVGSSIVVDTDIDGVKLIHTPTMRTPSVIVDPTVVYHCMRTCLMAAMDTGLKSVVVPAFGAATGRVPLGTVALMMYRAYKQLSDPPSAIDWAYAEKNEF